MKERLITVRRRHRLAGTPSETTESYSFSMECRLAIDPGLRLSLFPEEQPATEECCVTALNLLEKAPFGAYLFRMLGSHMPLIAALDLLADRVHTLTLGQLKAIALKTDEGYDTGLLTKTRPTRRLPPESGFFVRTKGTIQLGTVRLVDNAWRITRLLPLEQCYEEYIELPTLFVANLRHPL